MKRRRLRRADLPPMQGRRYYAEIEIVHAGGSLPNDARESLTSALHEMTRNEAADLSLTVSPHPYNRVTVGATVQATSPLLAVTRLDKALDDALMASGLFEDFDVTGKMLRVAPLDNVWRETSLPARDG